MYVRTCACVIYLLKTYTQTHTYMHACIPTYIHTHIHMHARTDRHIDTLYKHYKDLAEHIHVDTYRVSHLKGAESSRNPYLIDNVVTTTGQLELMNCTSVAVSYPCNLFEITSQLNID